MLAQACSSISSFVNSKTKFPKEPEVGKRRSPIAGHFKLRMYVCSYNEKEIKEEHILGLRRSREVLTHR